MLTLEKVDNGLFEALRLALVEAGNLPDITVIGEDDTAWEQAWQTIISNNKMPIMLYGVGGWKAKQALKYSTIIIERRQISPSSEGLRTDEYYEIESGEDATTLYTKKQTAVSNVVQYAITFVCEDVAQEYVIQTLLEQVLGYRKELQGINPDGSPDEEKFWVFRQGQSDQSEADFIEKVTLYNTSDVKLSPDTIIQTNIPCIKEINIPINPKLQIP